MKRGLIVGLTGGMACGKSTVAETWRKFGARVINSDDTVHRLMRDDADVRREIREAFGDDVFHPNGEVNRTALARIVFNDEPARQRLMGILHPRTRALHVQQATEATTDKPDAVVVIDSPLLFESGLDQRMDVTVTVASPHDAQIDRALRRANDQGKSLTRDEAERRIARQMPLDEKRRRATFVIENDGSLADLIDAAKQLFVELRKRAASASPR